MSQPNDDETYYADPGKIVPDWNKVTLACEKIKIIKRKGGVKMDIIAVDLFCGIGGLTHGLTLAGIPVVAGFDIDESCRFSYETNNSATFICKDVSDINYEW